MCILTSSQVHMMARQNIKKKYLMCQIPIKMVKQHAIRNSTLRFIHQKGAEKIGKFELLVPPS